MTTDAKQIEPAMNAEEWEFVTRRRVHAFIQATDDLPEHLRPEAWRREPPSGTLAIANAQLPDDSPYKITRADVEAIDEAVRGIAWVGVTTEGHATALREHSALARLRDKLAALLPPEG